MENIRPRILEVELRKKISDFLPASTLSLIGSLLETDSYLVGGVIRNILLDEDVKDIDILFPVSDIVKVESKVFNWSKLEFKKKMKLIRLMKDNEQIDIEIYKNNQLFSLEKNLKKRDFTINSMAISLREIYSKKIKLIDPFGGFEDINKRIIKINNAKSFYNDPLRILRAYRLKCQFGLKIEETTEKLIKENIYRLKNVSIERIRDEFFMILDLKCQETIEELYNVGVLKIILPELIEGDAITQGVLHDFDVLRHSLHTLKELETILEDNYEFFRGYNNYYKSKSKRNMKTLLKFSALVHDIGKPMTKKICEDKVNFNGHEKVGAEMVLNISKRLKLSNKECELLKKLVKNHLKPGYLYNLPLISKKALKNFIKNMGNDLIATMILFLADVLATKKEVLEKKDDYLNFCRFVLSFNNNEKITQKPLLSGDEVMNTLGIPQGKVVGKLLKIISDAQEDGVITTKSQAKKYLKEFYFSKAFE